jgi:hypothetical protein
VKATITEPIANTNVTGIVTVRGSISGSPLKNWVLDYGIGNNPTNWTVLNSGTTAMTNGVLGSLNTVNFAEDTRLVFRFTAYDTSDRSCSDYQPVKVDYVHITSPCPPVSIPACQTFKPVMLQISGKSPGSFTVKWAQGISPSSGWSSTGVTLVGGGVNPVSEGPLASWNAAAISTADYYTIRVQAGSRIADCLIYFEPSLLSNNWPQNLPNVPGNFAGIVPVDHSDGGTLLSLITEKHSWLGYPHPATLYKFTAQGQLLSLTSLAQNAYYSQAAGNLDSALGMELAVSNDSAGGITLICADNSKRFFLGDGDFRYSPIVLEDLDNDGQLEIIAVGAKAEGVVLYVWKQNGMVLNANFPKELAMNNIRFAVGDINGDRQKEIVCLGKDSQGETNFSLCSWDGTPLEFNPPFVSGTITTLILADLDHSGRHSLVISTDYQLHILDANGAERAGWPQNINGIETMAVGDLDNNGFEEIVYMHFDGLESSILNVVKADGTIFSNNWPYVLPVETTRFSSPGLALTDINGDGNAEILVCQKQFTEDSPLVLMALNKDKTIVRSWKLHSGTDQASGDFPQPKITSGDFDHNGQTDIAVAYETISATGGITSPGIQMTVLTTGSVNNPDANHWPMLLHDARNTSLRNIRILKKAPTDFDGNGKSDILWRHSGTGQVYEMPVNGNTVLPGAVIYTEPSSAWKIVGKGDFDSDTKTDILRWNSTSGQVYQMMMDGLTVKNINLIYTEADVNWTIQAVADFDGDYCSDLLWRHAVTGQVRVNRVKDSTVYRGVIIHTEPDVNWQIVASSDFDHDGKTDIVWRNSSTGRVDLMLMNGTIVKAWTTIHTEPDTAWKVLFAADFNGDNKADLLWRNSSTGQVYVMLFDISTIIGGAVIHTEPNPSWQIVNVGDYNGDSKADILWHHSGNGEVYHFLMNGTVIQSINYLYTATDIGWKIQ